MSKTAPNQGIIRVLDETVVSQIAAGEVVERPSSVVKELIENAVDAGAHRLEIEIKDGGQKLIEIVDDGCGMCQTDAVLAFSQHATSKLHTADDLPRLATLGFRGEALASIASVSRVTLITRQEDAMIGTRVTVEGGLIKSVEPSAHPRGTTIQVRNLFYNVPARRKFLKSIQVEMAQISDIICHQMLGYPELAFRFTRANAPIATSPGQGNLADAVLAVYGPEVMRTLIPLKAPDHLSGMGISVRGFISPPNQARPAARFMTTLVNRRVVKSRLLSQAIAKALSAFFPKGRYPVLVFDLRIPPDSVDINVHPQKTEVRFRDERLIFGLVLETLQTSLSGLRMVTPVELAPNAGEEEHDRPQQPDLVETSTASFAPPPANVRAFPSRASMPTEPAGSSPFPPPPDGMPLPAAKTYLLKGDQIASQGVAQMPPAATAGAFAPVSTLQEPRILAQLMNTYLLGEDREGMFIIDQHAAHERILFDTYVEAYREERVHAQPLLFPIPLQLLPSERLLLRERMDEFRHLGFTIQVEDDGQFYATAVPILDGRNTDGAVIQDLLAQLLGGWEGRSLAEVKADLFKMMACKAAIKAGDPLREPEMRSLFEQLLKTKNPFTCPHGRPVALRLTSRQIEHGFLRS